MASDRLTTAAQATKIARRQLLSSWAIFFLLVGLWTVDCGLGTARAALVSFGFTNSIGQADTNYFKAIPVSGPVANADGTFTTIGVPIRITPGPDGRATNFLAQNNWLITNAFLGNGYYIRVPLDSGGTVYPSGQLLIPGNAGGVNVFVTITNGPGGTNLPTFNQLTNIFFGTPIVQSNLPSLTNGFIGKLDATNISGAFSLSFSNSLYSDYTTRIAILTALSITNLYATNAPGVSWVAGRGYISTNYDALGTALAIGAAGTNYANGISNVFYALQGLSITNLFATNAAGVSYSGGRGYISTNYDALGTALAIGAAGTNFTMTASNALFLQIGGAGITAVTATNIATNQVFLGTNAIGTASGFSAFVSTNRFDVSGAALAATNGIGLGSGFSGFVSTNRFDVSGAATAATNGLAALVNTKADTNSPMLYTPTLNGGALNGVTNTSYLYWFDGSKMGRNGVIFEFDPLNPTWTLNINGSLRVLTNISTAGIISGNGSGVTNASSTNLMGAALIQSTNVSTSVYLSGLASGTNSPSFGDVTASGVVSVGSEVAIAGGAAKLDSLELTLGTTTFLESQGSATSPVRAWRTMTITPSGVVGPTNSFVVFGTPVYATSFNGLGAGITNASSSNLEAQALGQVTNVVNALSSGATTAITNAYGTNLVTGLVTGQRIYFPTNFVNPTNGFATGLISTNPALEGSVSFGQTGQATNIISTTNVIKFFNAGTSLVTNGVFEWIASGSTLYTNRATGARLANSAGTWLLQTNGVNLYNLTAGNPIGTWTVVNGDSPAPTSVPSAAIIEDGIIHYGFFTSTNLTYQITNAISTATNILGGAFIPSQSGAGTNNSFYGLSEYFTTLLGGTNNSLVGKPYGAILSGTLNQAADANTPGALIVGGISNAMFFGDVSPPAYAAIVGGIGNKSGTFYTFNGGGVGNIISNNASGSVIVGGVSNWISGTPNSSGVYVANGSAILGGQFNVIQAQALSVNKGSNAAYSSILGGQSNRVNASGSMAGGQNVTITNDNSFVWSDGTPANTSTNSQVIFVAINGVTVLGGGFTVTNLNNAAASQAVGVTSTGLLTTNGVPGGGSGTVISVGAAAPSGYSVSGVPITTSGTITLSRTADQNNLGFAETNIGNLQAGGLTQFGGQVGVNALIVTNNITNSTLTAATILTADGNKKISSMVNGTGFLTNNGAGVTGFLPTIDAANLSGTISGAQLSFNVATNVPEFIWSDDVGADAQCPLSTASWAWLIQRRYAVLDSFICSTPFTNQATFNEARLMNYYGINCPIGSDYNLGDFAPGTFLGPLSAWPVQFATVSNVDNGIALFRRRLQLALNRNRKVGLIFTGQIYTYYDLLNSAADTNSMYDGKTLVSNAVNAIYFMGGDYPNGTEFNFWSSTNRTLPGIFGLCPTNVPQYFYGDTFGRQVNFDTPPYSSIPTSPVKIINSSGFLWDEAAIWLSVLGTNLGTTNAVISWQQGSNNVFTIGNNQWVTNNANMYFAVWKTGGVTTFSNMMVSAMQTVDSPNNNLSRPTLYAPLTYYVSTTGADTNDGLSAASPLLTIQAAVNKALAWDFWTNNIAIQLANGTYSGSVLVQQQMGNSDWKDTQGELIIHGNDATPSSVIVTNASTNHLFLASKGARLSVRGLTVGSANRADADLFDVQIGSCLNVSNVVMGPCGASSCQIISEAGGWFWMSGPYTVTGGGLTHFLAQSGGSIWMTAAVTLSGTPAYTVAFAQAYSGGSINLSGGSFSGSATGAKYWVYGGGSIITFGVTNADNLFPGNSSPIQDLRLAERSGQPFTATNGMFGITDGSDAAAGVIGEFKSAILPNAGKVALLSNGVTVVTNLTLTSGDWDVSGSAICVPAGATMVDSLVCNIVPQTTNSLGVDGTAVYSGITTPIGNDTLSVPSLRVSTPTNCVVYLSFRSRFTGGPPTAYGQITARRVR